MVEQAPEYVIERDTRRSVKRALRLLCIERLLKERPHTNEELAEQCGVSVRTIRRDMALLQSEPWYLPVYRAWVLYRQKLAKP